MNPTATSEVTNMPCQCDSTATAATDVDTTQGGCGCQTESGSTCGCASGPDPSDRSSSLERVVMELDQRLRKLEARV